VLRLLCARRDRWIGVEISYLRLLKAKILRSCLQGVCLNLTLTRIPSCQFQLLLFIFRHFWLVILVEPIQGEALCDISWKISWIYGRLSLFSISGNIPSQVSNKDVSRMNIISFNCSPPSKLPGELIFNKKYQNEHHASFTDVCRTFIKESGTTELPINAWYIYCCFWIENSYFRYFLWIRFCLKQLCCRW
jgi:hypothetical protein